YMMALLDSHPDLYLDEVQAALRSVFESSPSLSTISRTLKLLGYSSKRLSKCAIERNAELRNNYLKEIGLYSPEQLVFADETSVNL
ncbi:hypothetical protein DL93DRAFT_2033173, partial [Clavulina sp. PMI_390]